MKKQNLCDQTNLKFDPDQDIRELQITDPTNADNTMTCMSPIAPFSDKEYLTRDIWKRQSVKNMQEVGDGQYTVPGLKCFDKWGILPAPEKPQNVLVSFDDRDDLLFHVNAKRFGKIASTPTPHSRDSILFENGSLVPKCEYQTSEIGPSRYVCDDGKAIILCPRGPRTMPSKYDSCQEYVRGETNSVAPDLYGKLASKWDGVPTLQTRDPNEFCSRFQDHSHRGIDRKYLDQVSKKPDTQG